MTIRVKESSGLSIVDRPLEAPLDGQDGYLTPNDRVFVCNSGTTPIIDAAEHVVQVHGDGVANERTCRSIAAGICSTPSIRIRSLSTEHSAQGLWRDTP